MNSLKSLACFLLNVFIILASIDLFYNFQVVYWSIKSTFDLVQYAVGSTNSFKGTGVWSFVEFDREPTPASSQPDTDAEIKIGKVPTNTKDVGEKQKK